MMTTIPREDPCPQATAVHLRAPSTSGGGRRCSTRCTCARSPTATTTGSVTCGGCSDGSTICAWLGVDALWLSPVMPSPNADWGYDVADYRAVLPEYGSMDDLDELIAAAGRVRHPGTARPRPQPHERPPRVVRGIAVLGRLRAPRLVRVGRPQARRLAAEQLGGQLRGPGVDASTPRRASTTCTTSCPSSPTSTGGATACATPSTTSCASGGTAAWPASASTSAT